MTAGIRSAHSQKRDPKAAANELVDLLSPMHDARAVVFFASPGHDGLAICRILKQAFHTATVIGCSTAGELSQHGSLTDSVSALVLGPGTVSRAASALAQFGEQAVEPAVGAALERIEGALDKSLRSADPTKYVGVALLEGLHMREEEVNAALGNQAPLLSFVGGSAGDNGVFERTRVFVDGEVSDDGAALLLLEVETPFTVSKTCSFEPKSHGLKVTRADRDQRILYELDGRPALEVYAEQLGLTPEGLDESVFMKHPLGLMIDGTPWIRSPMRVLPDGGLKLYCQVLEGAEVHVMQSRDLIAETRAELDDVREKLGGSIRGGLAFNCILRRLEMDADNLHGAFVECFAGTEMAGFHTYGESWLGHINQTLTGLWFR